MSSPRLDPWLIPDTIRSGSDSTRPSAAKRTQSTGVPSVANPLLPSANSTSSTQSGFRVVMLRAVALRLESGAITARSMSGASSSARRMAFRPVAWIPSSFVKRTFTPLRLVAHRLEVEPVSGYLVARLRARSPGQQLPVAVDAHASAGNEEHRSDQGPHHVAHEGVRLDPECEHLVGLLEPLRSEHVTLEVEMAGLRGRECRE